MENKKLVMRWMITAILVASVGSSVSCMTTYDANGRPMQTVDPGLAVAGVAAAGLLGYAAANNHNHHHHHGGYYGGGYYGGYRGGYCRR